MEVGGKPMRLSVCRERCQDNSDGQGSGALRAPGAQLPQLRLPRLYPHPAPPGLGFMRWLVVAVLAFASFIVGKESRAKPSTRYHYRRKDFIMTKAENDFLMKYAK